MQCGYQQQQAPPGWILPIGLALAGHALSSQVHLLQPYVLVYGQQGSLKVPVPKECVVPAVPQHLCCWHCAQVWCRGGHCRFGTAREQIQD